MDLKYYLPKKTSIIYETVSLRNSVQLIGRLGNEPEIKTFDSGTKKASFSLATNENYYNNKGEKVEETQWHQVVAWGKKVEIIESYLKKGSEVAVKGKLSNRSYETPTGEKRYVSEIRLNELLMLGKKD
jgi:single-strand DNA-binding protein